MGGPVALELAVDLDARMARTAERETKSWLVRNLQALYAYIRALFPDIRGTFPDIRCLFPDIRGLFPDMRLDDSLSMVA